MPIHQTTIDEERVGGEYALHGERWNPMGLGYKRCEELMTDD